MNHSNWADNEYYDPPFCEELPCCVCEQMDCVCDTEEENESDRS
jgi:hypothetical protein